MHCFRVCVRCESSIYTTNHLTNQRPNEMQKKNTPWALLCAVHGMKMFHLVLYLIRSLFISLRFVCSFSIFRPNGRRMETILCFSSRSYFRYFHWVSSPYYSSTSFSPVVFFSRACLKILRAQLQQQQQYSRSFSMTLSLFYYFIAFGPLYSTQRCVFCV